MSGSRTTSVASPFRQPKAVFAVAFACVVSFMGIGLVDPILPAISNQLHASPSEVTLLFTSYLVVTAVAMLISPDEHCRSIVCPATETGSPAASAAVRPIVCCTPWGRAAPRMQSSISAGSTLARATAARMACAAREGEGVALNAPR